MPADFRHPNIDPNELTLAVLAVLDQHHVGPEFRKVMHGEFGDLLERCGGARQVLQMALAAVRRGRFRPSGLGQRIPLQPKEPGAA